MYSWEIQQYIERHNYRLGADEIMFIQDINLHPQINHIEFNTFSNEYNIWTSDNYHFKFTPIPYSDYIQQIANKGVNLMKEPFYKLYINANYTGYEFVDSYDNIQKVFEPLDYAILDKQYENTSYLIIQHINGGDDAFWRCDGNIEKYLEFKEQYYIQPKIKKRGDIYGK